ncbi:MAG: aspartyl protease family protein [Nitrosopumilus sp.]
MVDLGRQADKLVFKYKVIPRWNEQGEPVIVKKPVIEVTFRRFSERKDENNREIRMLALVDSGADVSFIPLEIAQALRLDVDESDNKILTIAGITNVYQTKVHVEIPIKGKRPVIVGMINADVMSHESGEHVPEYVILGRKDFFEKFEVTINETAQTITLKDVHKDRLKPSKRKK